MELRNSEVDVFFVAICDRKGNLILSRTFSEFSAAYLNSLLIRFVSLASAQTSSHYVKLDGINFIYVPIAASIVVVGTSSNSNILVCFEELKLLAESILQRTELDKSDSLANHAIDFISIIDELFNNGYVTHLRKEELKNSLKMLSQEEDAYESLARQKAHEAREAAKIRAKRIDGGQISDAVQKATFSDQNKGYSQIGGSIHHDQLSSIKLKARKL